MAIITALLGRGIYDAYVIKSKGGALLMKKNYALKDVDIKKYYLIRKPTRLSDLDYEDMYADDYDGWREKSRRLQARRWRRIKHQLA